MLKIKKITFENFFVLYTYCNFLTFSKAFDSILDFENLGYQVEIFNLF